MADLGVARVDNTATPLPDGRVLVVGGIVPGMGDSIGSAELYDPGTKTFAPTGSLRTARSAHAAALLRSGEVLVGGGMNTVGTTTTLLRSAELYDPSTGTFSDVADLHVRVVGGHLLGYLSPQAGGLQDVGLVHGGQPLSP